MVEHGDDAEATLSDEQKKRQGVAVTTTVTQKETEGRSLEALTPLEERVLRMLHGLSESDDHELQFALGADDEQRARLAALEANLLEAFARDELPAGITAALDLDVD